MFAHERAHDPRSSIAVVLPSLLGGGAERVASELANYWAAQGRCVWLITLDALQEPRYPLDDRIERKGLGLKRDSKSKISAVWNNVQRVRALRRALIETGARAIVSFTDVTNVTTLIAAAGLNLKVVVAERTDPRHQDIGPIWSRLRSRWYRRADVIVLQTERVAQWARQQDWGPPIQVIPNPAPLPAVAAEADRTETASNRKVVALGRLSHEKGFDLLIEAFAKVSGVHPDWRLEIWGEGAERQSLLEQIERYGLASRVTLPGWTTRSENVLCGGSIFALPSRYEGFPNALLEAMAAGLACVAFDCESGPREIIRENVDGILVPANDVEQLAAALDRLMADVKLRRQLGTCARSVGERFDRQSIFAKWDALVERVESRELRVES